MYQGRPPLTDTHDLEQGDILRGILRPHTVIDKNFVLREGGKVNPKPPPEALRESNPNLRVMHALEREELSIAISNSCDNTLDLPLLFAVVRPFGFPKGTDTPEQQWRVVSEAATGTANTKLFYLPASPEFRFARSEARFTEIFSVRHSYLDRCVRDAGASRVCGLKPEATRHLQWALAVFFSRDPREDHAWPSIEDFELKAKWLETELAKGSRRQEEYKTELEKIRTILGK